MYLGYEHASGAVGLVVAGGGRHAAWPHAQVGPGHGIVEVAAFLLDRVRVIVFDPSVDQLGGPHQVSLHEGSLGVGFRSSFGLP